MDNQLISLGALLVSACALLLTSRRDTRGSAAAEAALTTRLDSISSGVQEIRAELHTLREGLNTLETRVTRA